MTDLRRKNEFIMTKCKCQMLGLIFNSVNLPGNFKTCGFFLLPKNPKLYADHFFYHGYLDAKIEEGSSMRSFAQEKKSQQASEIDALVRDRKVFAWCHKIN